MAGIVPQNYDFVTTDKDPILKFFDYGTLDGDAVQVKFNGQVLDSRIDLAGPSASSPVRLDLRTGINTLEVTALNVGTVANNTVGIDFPAGTVIYEKDGSGGYKDSSTGRFTAALPKAGTTYRLDFGLPLIRVDGTRFPEAAQHIIDTLEQPKIQTIDRLNAKPRRDNNVARYLRLNGDRAPARFGFQIDEAPPALLLENGFANTTRPIPKLDNEGAGGTLRQQIGNYGPQNKTLPNGANVDFFATSAPASRRVNGTEQDDNLTGTFGIDNLIYGLAGDDVLSGAPTNEPGSGNNTLFGGPGSDTLFGRAGDDLLLGQSDNDFLFGSSGSDVLYGGKGNDLLYGGSRIISDRTDDIDSFWFSPGEGTDTVRDLRPGIDLVVLDRGLNLGNTSTRYVQRSPSPTDFGSELVFGNQVLAYFPRILPEDLNQSLSEFG